MLNKLTSDRRWQGTIIELPLSEITPDKIMESFELLAGIMTIFSKQIRRIEIRSHEESRTWEWRPERIRLSDSACLEIGELPLRSDLQQKLFSIYFRLPIGGVFVGLGPGGFRDLPHELPAVWVVAPTRESEGLGIAINCMFDLDAGRARLAGNSAVNEKKALELGRQFGHALLDLYEWAQTNWEELKKNFRLEDDLSAYEFWAALWDVFTTAMLSRGNDEVSLIVNNLLSKHNGIGYLVTKVDAMPNGLWGDSRALNKPEKVRFVLQGVLTKEYTFRALNKWEYFRNLIGSPEEVITGSVFSGLKKVLPSFSEIKSQWKSLYLYDILRDYADNKRKITPNIGEIIGSLLNSAALKQEEFEKEKDQILSALRNYSFQAADGSFQSPNELFETTKHSLANPDEAKRASFAPDNYVLSSKYQGKSLEFFLACREKISIPIEDMAKWIVNAKSTAKRERGLRYLLDGEYGEKVAEILRESEKEGTWLYDLDTDSPYFQGWDEDDISELLYRKLPPIEQLCQLHEDRDEEAFELPEEELLRYEPQEVLRRIFTWWTQNKDEYLEQYEKKIYPGGILPDLEEDDFGRINRASWLTLLSLSHFHTIGRQRDFQHRGFIEKCMQRGWWEVFAKEHPENRSDEWMRVLEEYIEEQVDVSEYEIWMNRFPAIYRFARWLDDYREVFMSLERQENLGGISGILKSKTNPVFQGGGVSAPPIEKSLGIGACFILRELRRKKILNTDQVVPYCYVPVRRVRELCQTLGCRQITEDSVIDNSKNIYQFLSDNLGGGKATFFESYDIPLQILSENQDLLRSILA